MSSFLHFVDLKPCRKYIKCYWPVFLAQYCFYYLAIYNITTENGTGLLINMTLPKQIQKHAHMNFQTLFVKSLVPTVELGISAVVVAAFYSN